MYILVIIINVVLVFVIEYVSVVWNYITDWGASSRRLQPLVVIVSSPKIAHVMEVEVLPRNTAPRSRSTCL
jgi:hypothetical protein